MNLKTTLSLFFIFCFCFLAKSQIVNKGVLKIGSGTIVSFQDEYTNATTGNHVSDGNFYLNNNFINHGLTSASAGTTYFKSATNSVLAITGDSQKVNFYNLEIDVTAPSKKGVSVADEFRLEVANALLFKSGDLRMVGNSQLIQVHAGANKNTVVSGKLLIDQQGTSSPYQYDYWSSPVNNGGTFSIGGGKFDGSDAAINPFNPTAIQVGSGSPYNGLPSTIDVPGNVIEALTVNKRWLYQYAKGSGAYSEWIALNASSALMPGEGYTMKGPDAVTSDQNYVFYGAPNSGDYNFPITAGENILLGNPYPSDFNAESFISDNLSVLDVLYFWVDGGTTSHYLSDYFGGYATKNLTGGTVPSVASPLIAGVGTAGNITAPTRYVPIGKAFFIEAKGTGTINFKNTQRVFEVENAKASQKNAEQSLENSKVLNDANQYIRVGYRNPEGFHRQLLLGFLPNTTADLNHNAGYDAIQFRTRADDMFFVIEGNATKRYTIQGVNRFSEAMEFPIGLIISETGTHQLMIDAQENFSDTVYLKDNVLNVTHNLTESKFDISLPLGEHLNRYSLVFQPAGTLATATPDLENTVVFYNGNNQIVVTKPSHLEVKSIDIYNVVGQHILTISENLNNQSNISIPFNKSQGVYIVVLNTETSKKSTKILKY
ncbi:putative secreted protein (Por secretion system target) [Gelidibacter algens]|uniref:Putative secreted protein (Por secretion system target) n=1 Tax=Gelidibacter algens TaxID=49280 RepID=A0A1A7QZS4_9FLAO|nr:T9SS sorting signal type C domain-containing protein [Gelidibacter algens]OBX24724.1 ABC transporter permease [Gelidibacter algens]RAJ19303.1 putative secreted protein (Por secretion system target) [Gelidibacter algens]